MNPFARFASRVRDRAVAIGNRVRNRVTGRQNLAIPSQNMRSGH